MATAVEIVLDEDLLVALQHRVRQGESASLSDLIQADLRQGMGLNQQGLPALDPDFLAGVLEAYDEMDADPDSGVPIEDIMRRYGMRIPGTDQKA